MTIWSLGTFSADMVLDTIINFQDQTTKRKFLVAVGALNVSHEVILKPWKPRRSNQANKFWWKVVVESFCSAMREQGETWSKERAHEFIVQNCLGMDDVVNPRTGEVVGQIRKETHELNTEDFSAMTERAIVWLADFGIEVPVFERML